MKFTNDEEKKTLADLTLKLPISPIGTTVSSSTSDVEINNCKFLSFLPDSKMNDFILKPMFVYYKCGYIYSTIQSYILYVKYHN